MGADAIRRRIASCVRRAVPLNARLHYPGHNPLFDGTDVESQDSGIGGSRREEIDLKDHGIEGCAAVRPPHTPSSRDPRIRKVSVAGPSRLYGRTSTPMIDPQNIASTEATNNASVSSDEEEKLVICLGDD